MTDIDKLIRMNIELEGLLKVLRDRDSLEARDLLSEKIEEYTSALNSFLFARHNEDESLHNVIDKGEDALQEAHHVEVKDQEAQEAEESQEDYSAERAVEKDILTKNEKNEDKEIHVHAAYMPEYQPSKDATDKRPNLLKAFTINDRFRFRRELFAGDDEDFNETLHLISDMDSYSEACDYLYNDMMWDRNDPTVEEFMAILASNLPQ